MSESVEPPILLSRLMTFVFSAALVVVIVLVVTLVKMYPLNKTQVFFLTTQPRSDLEIKLSSFSPNEENIEFYKQAFIKEYIKARNEIIPNAGVMQKKWSASEDGTVYMWSTPEVYANFAKTQMWTAYMDEVPDFEFHCPVEFTGIAPHRENKKTGELDTYAVSFRYFCTNSDGQKYQKDYTIILKLELGNKIKWTDRLDNPLGIRVSEYKVESGEEDPLEFKWISETIN
ncbi:MAG TPA: VirB8/TrbF family protein [Alphaproteobacteria bacterium]|nr:VirB8/TrbF family protein [Alphaproteobacteria bacterium]